jgi:hypothetical protein
MAQATEVSRPRIEKHGGLVPADVRDSDHVELERYRLADAYLCGRLDEKTRPSGNGGGRRQQAAYDDSDGERDE